MAVINRITIENIEASVDTKGVYSFDANWDVSKSGASYTGSYYMQIISDNKVINEQVILNVFGETAQNGVINLNSAVQDAFYYLVVADETKKIFSEPVMLLLQTYENVKANYDGKAMNVYWSKPADRVKAGRCSVNSIEESVVSYEISPNSRHLTFDISLIDYDASNIWTLSLRPTNTVTIDGNLSQSIDGPSSGEVRLYTENPIIKSIVAEASEGENIQLNISFTHVYQTATELMVKPILWKDEEAFISFQTLNMPVATGGVYSISVAVNESIIETFERQKYAISLHLCTATSSNNMLTKGNYMSLPEANIFVSGYYPVVTDQSISGLAYRSFNEQESSVSAMILEPLFNKPLTQPITVGDLSLNSLSSSRFKLTIGVQSPLTKADYLAFMKNLLQNGLTNSGFYKLQDAIVRLGNVSLSDLLYFYCGLDARNRMVDLKPGMILEVETADYMPVYKLRTVDAIPGFIASHKAQYQISMTKANGDVRLEFNSFVNQFADNFTVDSSESIIQAGGNLDLFVTGFRQAFYRIVYPGSFASSDVEQNRYQSDNILLVAASSYDQLLSLTDMLIQKGSVGDNINAPILLFRGRPTVTPLIHIWLNETSILVPVGTSLSQLLERHGLYCINARIVSMSRLSLSGYVPVSLQCTNVLENVNTFDFWKGLSLLPGDKVEVK